MIFVNPLLDSIPQRHLILSENLLELGFFDLNFLQAIPLRIFGSILSNDLLLAIPFFTFMGAILERCGLAEEMLEDGRAYLLGAAPSLADCALYNPVWFIKERLGGGKAVPPLDRLPRLAAWSERMKAIGSGNPTEMSAADALAVANAAKPAACSVDAADPSGLKAGQKISVTPDAIRNSSMPMIMPLVSWVTTHDVVPTQRINASRSTGTPRYYCPPHRSFPPHDGKGRRQQCSDGTDQA